MWAFWYYRQRKVHASWQSKHSFFTPLKTCSCISWTALGMMFPNPQSILCILYYTFCNLKSICLFKCEHWKHTLIWKFHVGFNCIKYRNLGAGGRKKFNWPVLYLNSGLIPGSQKSPGGRNGNPTFSPPDRERRVNSPALSARGSRPSPRILAFPLWDPG